MKPFKLLMLAQLLPTFVSVILGAAVVRAYAGLDVPPAAPDLSGYATKGDVTAIQTQMPVPATTVPPTESPSGSPGSPGTYRPGNAVQPRITRSKTVVLDATGQATFDWASQGALTMQVQAAVTPVYVGSGVPKCWVTAISSTSASIKCVVENNTLINLAAVTAGINLNGGSAAGISVGIIVLPTS